MKNTIKICKLTAKAALSLMLLLQAGFAFPANDEGQWVATWGASPFGFQSFGNAAAPASFENQTIRQVVRISVGGDQVRIRFSNEIGTEPLVIGSASVGKVKDGASVAADSLHALAFGGKPGITIPPGAPALSDPVDLNTEYLDELAISLYLPESAAPTTTHAGRIAFISSAGDFTQSPDLPQAKQDGTLVFLTGVYVNTTADTRVFVAFGDSITDGTASTPFSFMSWPDQLALRLKENKINDLAVINHGISGNQVLRDGAGSSALARFDRDVLSTPGLTHIVVMEGINDIGSGGMAFFGPEGSVSEMRTAADLIAGYEQLISRAHSHGVKIFGATLTPFEGTFAGYYSPGKDVVRREVNEWIRTSDAFDGVIDFDRAIQDPGNANVMKAEYNSGDSLHPGDKGYERMADFIDLSLFD